MDRISASIGKVLPKGASDVVDKVGLEIVREYGQDKLRDIAKLNFKNTERILK